ncbi:MAG: fasciclin domain-containing protein [Flavobacteriales bacterium]|jgi:uncharacterized surface protein with fasciclin (FAS1) repeats|nr:fasciclin domain-containing protein [Flavobacteriales bacterium]MBK7941675.1 fasciclin domain-containing protein [Flavobacteriales bacterium]MBK8949298.1 fasciclin domain-containing protein [Flavobacteriales bacterium]MBK9700217.1 fasciclin domain-containing protein [Flavobacteriales bacterium]
MSLPIPSKNALALVTTVLLAACGAPDPGAAPPADATAPPAGGQSTVVDEQSQKNIVAVAVGSKDHTTLVAAVKAAEYVDVLSNAGPFTVFAPVNDAFAALPAGTVEGLLKPEKKADLQNILEYHVWVGVLKPEQLTDGKVLNMVNLKNATISRKDGKLMINDATVVASVPTSNGIIHVIDKVLLPG